MWNRGRVLIDGQDVRDVTLASLRANMALVSQEILLFDDTVRANIAYGRPGATDAEIEMAARNAAAHDFISALPEGYDTMVERNTAPSCRVANANASPSRAPCCAMRRSFCSTRPPRRSTPNPNARCRRRWKR